MVPLCPSRLSPPSFLPNRQYLWDSGFPQTPLCSHRSPLPLTLNPPSTPAGHSTSRRTTTASVPEPSSINTPLRTTRGFSAAGLAPSRTPLAATEAHVNVASLWQTSMSASELTLRSAHANGSPSEVRSLTVSQMPCPDAPAPGGQASVTTAVQRMPVLSQAREAFKKGVQGVHALLGI